MILRNAFKLGYVKKGYKVTICMSSTDAPFCGILHYKLNQWTIPNVGCGPCAVFANYKDALNIVRHYDRCLTQLWKCYFIESKEEFLWTQNGISRYILRCYDGTVLANAVMLIREIKLW